MILAKPEILAARERGEIMIEPLNLQNVQNSSVDVTLGPWYWIEQNANDGPTNLYDEDSVRANWAYREAQPIRWALPGIPEGTPILTLNPGQNALCATNEFIGGCNTNITTMMKARSSLGRNQITVCRCAGMGDVGYSDRWTLEITNNSKRPVILVVGRRIAQIVFFRTTGLESEADAYFARGKYQTGSLAGLTLDALEARWTPEAMLPKMWRDREVGP